LAHLVAYEMLHQRMDHIFEKIFALFVVLFFLFPGCYKLYSFLLFKQNSVLRYGTVVKQGMGQMGCKPFIEVYDDKGLRYEIKSEVNYYFFTCPKIGDRVEILYDKLAPEKSITVSLIHYLIIPLIMISIGLMTFYVAFLRRKESLEIETDVIDC
jgi:hypothetical protein